MALCLMLSLLPVKLAGERDIVVMTCPKRMYEACGLLYYHGLRGYCDGND